MKIITFTELKKKLAKIMYIIHIDNKPIVITKENSKPTVFMSLERFNKYSTDSAEQETLYLLSSPKNAEHLKRSIAEAKK